MSSKPLICVLFIVAVSLFSSVAFAQVGATPPEYDERVKQLLEEKEITYTVDADGDFKVEFEMGNGRTQLAFIMSATYEYGNFEIREIQAYAYRAPDGEFPLDVTVKLLEDTFDKKLGAWGIVDEYAVFITRIAADTDPESLWNALILALESADEMEQELSGDVDEF